MFPDTSKYLDAKNKDRPLREVTNEEFIAIMVAAGKTKSQASLQATLCVGLGSQVLCGDEWLKVKK